VALSHLERYRREVEDSVIADVADKNIEKTEAEKQQTKTHKIPKETDDAKGPDASASFELCSACHTEILPDDNAWRCPNCRIPFHEECWHENMGCAAYGCEMVGCLKKDAEIKVSAEETERGDTVILERTQFPQQSFPEKIMQFLTPQRSLAKAMKFIAYIALATLIIGALSAISDFEKMAGMAGVAFLLSCMAILGMIVYVVFLKIKSITRRLIWRLQKNRQ
jgi:hypothetical protein